MDDLRRRLSTISVYPHQWELTPVYARWRERVLHADITYTHAHEVPNELVYRFPVHYIGEDCFVACYVCIHPSISEKLTHGLYFEGEEVRGNSMRDYLRFWRPLFGALRHGFSSPQEDAVDLQVRSNPEIVRRFGRALDRFPDHRLTIDNGGNVRWLKTPLGTLIDKESGMHKIVMAHNRGDLSLEELMRFYRERGHCLAFFCAVFEDELELPKRSEDEQA